MKVQQCSVSSIQNFSKSCTVRIGSHFSRPVVVYVTWVYTSALYSVYKLCDTGRNILLRVILLPKPCFIIQMVSFSLALNNANSFEIMLVNCCTELANKPKSNIGLLPFGFCINVVSWLSFVGGSRIILVSYTLSLQKAI